jgi:hypothetical protein
MRLVDAALCGIAVKYGIHHSRTNETEGKSYLAKALTRFYV